MIFHVCVVSLVISHPSFCFYLSGPSFFFFFPWRGCLKVINYVYLFDEPILNPIPLLYYLFVSVSFISTLIFIIFYSTVFEFYLCLFFYFLCWIIYLRFFSFPEVDWSWFCCIPWFWTLCFYFYLSVGVFWLPLWFSTETHWLFIFMLFRLHAFVFLAVFFL